MPDCPIPSRNVLVGKNHSVKISDFGLSRALSKDESYYKLSQISKLPVKWMALESLLYQKFSTFSDGKSVAIYLRSSILIPSSSFCPKSFCFARKLLSCLHVISVSNFAVLQKPMQFALHTGKGMHIPSSSKTTVAIFVFVVWSYGVVLWEVFSYGKTPYKGIEPMNISRHVQKGKRLSCPQGCPQAV